MVFMCIWGFNILFVTELLSKKFYFDRVPDVRWPSKRHATLHNMLVVHLESQSVAQLWPKFRKIRLQVLKCTTINKTNHSVYLKLQTRARILRPVQWKPSPKYPSLQAQVKLPPLFVHVACWLHPPLLTSHSFTSVIRNTTPGRSILIYALLTMLCVNITNNTGWFWNV